MSDIKKISPIPNWFWVVSILALAWNLMGFCSGLLSHRKRKVGFISFYQLLKITLLDILSISAYNRTSYLKLKNKYEMQIYLLTS